MQQPTKMPHADKIYSTYWWRILLNPANVDNNPNVSEITGYSKFQGQDEAQDKEQLLMKKIYMLVSRGYLRRSMRIEIYYRNGKLIDKSTSPRIVSLTKNTFAFDEYFLQSKFQSWHRFVGDLYTCIKEGKDFSNLIPRSKPQFSKDDWMNPEKVLLNSPDQLSNYCAKMIRNGHAFDAVAQFFRKYNERKGWKL